MKKGIILGMTLLFASAAFVSCSKSNDFDEVIKENIVQTYENAFIKKFGQPASDHQWGFDVYGVPQAEVRTRGNGNWDFSCRIIGEDLSVDENSDFDFNDIVFDVVVEGKKNTQLILQAAGGIYPIYIKHGNKEYEVHEEFGVATTQMVNTGAGSIKLDPVTIQTNWNIPNVNSVSEINIYVEKNGQRCELKADQGRPAAKICVPIDFEWCNERQSIEKVYKSFDKWVANQDYIWF